VTVIRYQPEALEELEESVSWYDRAHPGLGARFAARVENTLDRIAEAPRSFPVILRVHGATVHRSILEKFPYAVVFLPLESEVRILAVANMHRRPGYWRGRV
jgi:plasmid stabilization system protein ParE